MLSYEDKFLFESERVINKCSKLSNKSKLTKAIVDAYIESVTWYGDNKIEIVFKFEDVIMKRMSDEDLKTSSF